MMSLFKKSILPLPPHTISIRRHISARSIRSMASEASKQVHRITMFKIPDPSNIQPILDKYSTMAQDAKKVFFQARFTLLMAVFLTCLYSGRQTIHSPMRSWTGSQRCKKPGLHSGRANDVLES